MFHILSFSLTSKTKKTARVISGCEVQNNIETIHIGQITVYFALISEISQNKSTKQAQMNKVESRKTIKKHRILRKENRHVVF